MAKINILDKSIYNRIAAGEVVERPSSIVKECVENSIDAGATSISIEIVGGGIKKIAISDNGDGIEYESIANAFLPHATSKIKTADDLQNIATLGFRGEALASIGAVSQTTIISKYKDNDFGGKITDFGGEISAPVVVGSPQGTFVTVENLFYNVPARAKFLRSPKVEEGYITNIIARFILANPTISFKYTSDGKIVYQTVGKSLKDAIYAVYGAETVDNLLQIEYSYDNITISGYVAKSTFAKPNKTYQTLVINGRYVINNIVASAVYSAYENYLMKGKFPFYVLHLVMPYDSIDVNVHPNKLDVRFVNQSQIFGVFSNVVAKAMIEANNIVTVQKVIDLPKELPILPSNSGKSFGESIPTNEPIQPIEKHILPTNINFKQEEPTPLFAKTIANDVCCEQKSFAQQFDASSLQSQQTLDIDSQVKIIGVIFNTYIIVEYNDKVYFIDQHAGHERLLYDKYKLSFEQNNVVYQDLLFPYIFKVNSIESEFLNKNISNFAKLGFTIEEFGNLTYRVTSVPMILGDIIIKDFVDDCLSSLQYISKNTANIEHILATTACKAAVKGGQRLSETEIKQLLDNLISSKTVLLCPHGRPIIVEVKRTELEKWFKRIL